MDALLAKLRLAQRPLWVLHVNADADCVGSANVLREAFGGIVGAPEGLSKEGRALATRLRLEIDVFPHPEKHDLVVAVDTSSRSQLGRLAAYVATPCLVDHHRYGDLLEGAPAAAWDPARPSCCEVALALIERADRAPSAEAAFGLLCGIVSDTARFRFADEATLATAARLLRASGATMEQAMLALEADDEEDGDDPSRRRAILVAAQRVSLDQWGDWIVAVSEVGAHDAAAAAALVRIGADLAVVGREKPELARMSLRASPRLISRGLHLGEVANAAAREAGWSGGGHEAAAGLTGKPPLAPVQATVVRLARQKVT